MIKATAIGSVIAGVPQSKVKLIIEHLDAPGALCSIAACEAFIQNGRTAPANASVSGNYRPLGTVRSIFHGTNRPIEPYTIQGTCRLPPTTADKPSQRSLAMQSNLSSTIMFNDQDLPALPEQGPLEIYLYQSPLIAALACVAIGIIVFGALRHTKHARKVGLPALLIGIVAGGAIYLVGSMVVTDHEHLKARSTMLVQAAAAGDAQALDGLLDDQVHIQTAFAAQTGKDRIIALASTRAAPIIDSATTKEVRAGLYGDQVARTQIRVRVDGDMLPSNSWWAIDWNRPSTDSDLWVATRIEPIWIQGFSNPAGN